MRKTIHEAHPSLVTKKYNLINDYLYEALSSKRMKPVQKQKKSKRTFKKAAGQGCYLECLE